MDKLIDYVLQNLKQLTPFHVLLVLILTIIASAGIFVIIRWLFVSRFEAQRDLLSLKAEQVTELKGRLDELKSESKQITLQVTEATTLSAGPSPLNTPAAVKTWRVLLALMWLHTLGELRINVWRVLSVYIALEVPIRLSIPSAKSSHDLLQKLEDATKGFSLVNSTVEAFEEFAPAVFGNASAPVPDGLATFPFLQTSEALEAVRKEIADTLDAFFMEWEKNSHEA